MDTKQLDSEYIAPTYARFPVEIVSGKGALCTDADGKEYIDMGTGIGVNIFGYCDDIWLDAVTHQAAVLQHTSNLYYTKPCATLAAILCEKTGMKKVFFSNSGAEANECAIKAARKYAQDVHGEEYFNIITLENSFHGRTLTTLAATGQDEYHKLFTPLTPGFLYATPNDIDSVKKLLAENKCAAVMMEIIQGEGGVVPLDADFIREVRKITEEQDVLLIIDEVQTGNGRTGELYAYMNFGITPDIVSTAKGLAGGLPLGATLLGEKAQNVLTSGTHGSTFGGNPVCCAAAISVLGRIDDELLSSVREKSAYIKSQLENADGVKAVTGLGLMLGIETEKAAGDVVSKCIENGVLVLKAKNKVRLLPPLNIDDELFERAVSIIKSSIIQA